MPLGNVLVVLILIGVAMWLVQIAPFIAAQMKTFITYALIVVAVLFVASLFVNLGHLSYIRVGK